MKEIIHDFLQETIHITKDDKFFSSCAQCLLDKPKCGDICLTAGTRYHVSKVVRYPWYKVVIRFFRNLFYSHY